MIDREREKLVLVCDSCGEEVDGFKDYDALMEFHNEKDWKSELGENIEGKDDYVDTCPRCRKKK